MKTTLLWPAMTAVGLALGALGACSDPDDTTAIGGASGAADGGTHPDGAAHSDAGMPADPADAGEGGDGGLADAGVEPDCFTHPTTSLELLNACTDAERIDKAPVLPLLRADGSRPPLP